MHTAVDVAAGCHLPQSLHDTLLNRPVKTRWCEVTRPPVRLVNTTTFAQVVQRQQLQSASIWPLAEAGELMEFKIVRSPIEPAAVPRFHVGGPFLESM